MSQAPQGGVKCSEPGRNRWEASGEFRRLPPNIGKGREMEGRDTGKERLWRKEIRNRGQSKVFFYFLNVAGGFSPEITHKTIIFKLGKIIINTIDFLFVIWRRKKKKGRFSKAKSCKRFFGKRNLHFHITALWLFPRSWAFSYESPVYSEESTLSSQHWEGKLGQPEPQPCLI